MSPIKQLSSIRRLPRAGIIRLGVRVKTGKKCKCGGKNKSCLVCMGTGIIHRPKETSYFVVPPKVQEVYGQEPKKLKILIPVEDEEVFFKQFYYSYGKGFLLCKGDGEEAVYWDFDKGDYQTRKCPCEKLEQGKCSQTGILQFILPDVEESAGVWQITTHSRNSIIDINSGIDYVRGIAGRIAFVPLWLVRDEIGNYKKPARYRLNDIFYLCQMSLRLPDYRRLMRKMERRRRPWMHRNRIRLQH